MVRFRADADAVAEQHVRELLVHGAVDDRRREPVRHHASVVSIKVYPETRGDDRVHVYVVDAQRPRLPPRRVILRPTVHPAGHRVGPEQRLRDGRLVPELAHEPRAVVSKQRTGCEKRCTQNMTSN